LVLVFAVPDLSAYASFGADPRRRAHYAAEATAIGARAAALASEGRSVSCVVTKNANTIRLLTHGAPPGRVEVFEFYRRPADPREALSGDAARGVFLLERAPALARIEAVLRARRVAREERDYVEFPSGVE
jgi:hypothetical protein